MGKVCKITDTNHITAPPQKANRLPQNQNNRVSLYFFTFRIDKNDLVEYDLSFGNWGKRIGNFSLLLTEGTSTNLINWDKLAGGLMGPHRSEAGECLKNSLLFTCLTVFLFELNSRQNTSPPFLPEN